MSSLIGEQLLFVTVKVNVTVPVDISLTPGVYIGSSEELLLKVPSPDVVHKLVPFKDDAEALKDEVEQIATSTPASTVEQIVLLK